jgi:hypothetical protein
MAFSNFKKSFSIVRSRAVRVVLNPLNHLEGFLSPLLPPKPGDQFTNSKAVIRN